MLDVKPRWGNGHSERSRVARILDEDLVVARLTIRLEGEELTVGRPPRRSALQWLDLVELSAGQAEPDLILILEVE